MKMQINKIDDEKKDVWVESINITVNGEDIKIKIKDDRLVINNIENEKLNIELLSRNKISLGV